MSEWNDILSRQQEKWDKEWSILQTEWSSIGRDLEWNSCHEWMKIHFISFMVVDEDVSW